MAIWPGDGAPLAQLLERIREGVSDSDLDGILASTPFSGLDAGPIAEIRRLADHLAAANTRRLLDGVLHEMTLELAGKRDRQSALAAIVRKARAVLGTDMAYISLNDFQLGETYIHTVDGVTTTEFRSIRMPFGTGVLGVVAHNDVPSQTSDYFEDQSLLSTRILEVDDAVAKEGVRSILGAPLKIEGRVIGALLVADRHPHSFGANSVTMISSMAALAAVAVETTQLLDELNASLARLYDSQEETRRYVAELERLEQADSTLMAALASMEGRSRVAMELQSLLGAPVSVLGVEELPGVHGIPDLAAAVASSASSGESVAGGHPGAPATVMAAVVNGQIAGAVLVHAALDDSHRAVLHRAAMALSAQLLFERAIGEADTREQSELLEQLVEGADPGADPVLARRLASFGIRPDVALGVISIACRDRDLAAAVVAREIGRRGLVTTHYGHVCVILPTDSARSEAEALLAALAAASVTASAGCADRGGAPGLREAHARAHALSRALDSLGLDGQAADETTMGSAGLMLGNASPELPMLIVDGTLGVLIEHDRRHQTKLVPTAAAFMDAGRSIARCAGDLHYHQNTVRQRLDRIDGILGPSWREGPRALDIHLALRIWQLAQPGA